jgi:hypothetical protein
MTGPTARAALAGLAGLSAAAGLSVLASAPAGADASSPSNNGGASLLGGWNLTSSASGLSVFYEQPNFPLPATPTLQFDLGYSTASYNSGPVGEANASAVWPGDVVAGGGSQLKLLFGPYLPASLMPFVPNFGNWALQALSAYPQGPARATNDNGPVAMQSSADQSGTMASSSLGVVGGQPSQSSLPAGLLTIRAAGSTSQDTVDNLGNAVSEATSTVHGIDIAGGLVHVGEVTSTATSSSDGSNATVSGTSTVADVTVAGESVTVDSSGVHVQGNNVPGLDTVTAGVNQILATAGISLSLTKPTDTVNGPSGVRQLDGLTVKWDLSTYDQDFSQLVAGLGNLPQCLSLTAFSPQLPTFCNPVPAPYKQSLTLDFGWVNVNAAASPAYNPPSGGDVTGSDNGALSTFGPAGGESSPTSDFGLGPSPIAGETGTGGSTPSGSVPPGSGGTPISATTAPTALFKGIGTGLIGLGLLLTALLVALLVGVDRAVGRLAAAAAPCVEEGIGDLG